MATATAASSTDQLPLLSPPAIDLPSFDSYPPEYYTPHAHLTSHTQSQRNATTDNVDTQSILPPYSPPTGSYRGHASEAEYLAALRAWAEEKMYDQPKDKCALPGFYGKETMRDCIAKNPELGLRLGRKKRKENKMEVEGEVEREGEGERVQKRETNGVTEEGRTGRRKSSLGDWLSRKRTA